MIQKPAGRTGALGGIFKSLCRFARPFRKDGGHRGTAASIFCRLGKGFRPQGRLGRASLNARPSA